MKTFTNLIKRASLSTFNKKRYYLFIIMLLALGVTNAWADDVTFSWAGFATADGGTTDYVVEQTPVTLTFAAGTAQNAPRANKEGSVRMYANTTLTISCASGNITKVTFTPTTVSYNATKLKYNGTALTSDEWTLSSPSNEVTLTASANARFKTIVVTYTSAGGGDEPPTSTTTYTIKWHTAKGVTTDVTLNEGATITKPTTDPTMTDYDFRGWTASCDVASDGSDFTALTDFGTADSDKNFYAVFAVAETPGGGGATETSVSVSIQNYASANSWANGTKYTSVKIDENITASVSGSSNTGKYYTSGHEWRLYQTESPKLTLSAAEGKTIKTAKITYNVSNNGVLKLNSSNVTSGTTSTINASSVTYNVGNSGSATNGQVKVTAIEVVYTSGSAGSTTYDNYITTCSGSTPVETLKDAQFAWSAATAEATMGASNTFPDLINTLPVTVTYESSNTDAATIAADGTITLVAPGTTTISAKFAGGEVSGTTYAPKTVTYALTVLKAPATPTGTVYVKVTDAVTDGEYLIVYEDAASTPSAPVIFDGSLATLDAAGNMKSVTISGNVINGDTEIDAATFTISAITDGFAIKSKSGKYIGRTSSGNGINTGNSEILNTITITDGVVKIAGSGSGASTSLQYYSVSGQERFRYYGTTQKAIALYKKASKHTVTIADCTNGSVSASVANGAQVLSGTTITLSNTPTTDYKLSAYDVYKTGDETTKVTVTDGKFVMPEFDVTISATFVPVKTLTSIDITTAATQTTFWQGETFNHTGLVVTAHFDGAEDEVVTPTVNGSTATAGTQTVTVSYTEGTVTKTATYTIEVKAIPNTKETAYTVADAYDIIDKLTTAEGVFISGIISQVDSYNDTYKSITYWISTDGTTTKQLQVYSGKGLESADFTAVTDLTVGDQVIICGNLKKYSGTYEFDKNNYLASHTPTTKDPAGLEYATTEYTANVGEAFATPVLTNPNGLTVTYSTSDASKATVDASTGEVTIVAEGTVTITASTTGDATHDAGSASYTITISDPSKHIAQLPFTYNSGKAAIETTAGITHSGLGSDYTTAGVPPLKFDTEGDYVIVRYDQQAGEFSFVLKQNGQTAGTFTVYESANGEDYTPVWTGGDLGNAQSATITPTLAAASRYVKFEYTTKPSGTNYGLGSISIQKPDLRKEAGIAWSAETTTITIGDAFTAPTLSNPNGLTLTCTSDNDALATVTNAGVITLKEGVTGKAVITATFTANENYKGAEVTTTIYVNPKTDDVVILAKYNGQWYAMMAEYVTDNTDRLAAVAVNYVGGKLYNVSEEDKAAITWKLSVNGGNATFQNGTNYLVGSTSTTLSLNETAFDWAFDGSLYLSDSDSRTFIYHKDGYFRNYAKGNPENYPDTYSTLPVVTAPVFVDGQAYGRSVNLGTDGYRYGTICLPFGSTNFTGAEFFECVGKEEGKVFIGSVTTLVAGTPYIFLASATEVAVYGDGTTAATPGSKNGLVGTFTNDTEVAVGNYILKDNALCQAADICWVNANRAYLVMSDVPEGAPQQLPGRRYIGMSVQGENEATGFENITAPADKAVKAIINGQLIIIRDGEMYNAQGQLIK